MYRCIVTAIKKRKRWGWGEGGRGGGEKWGLRGEKVKRTLLEAEEKDTILESVRCKQSYHFQLNILLFKTDYSERIQRNISIASACENKHIVVGKP